MRAHCWWRGLLVTKTTDTTHYIELLEQKDEKDDRKCRKCRISDIFKYAPFPHAINMQDLVVFVGIELS